MPMLFGYVLPFPILIGKILILSGINKYVLMGYFSLGVMNLPFEFLYCGDFRMSALYDFIGSIYYFSNVYACVF